MGRIEKPLPPKDTGRRLPMLEFAVLSPIRAKVIQQENPYADSANYQSGRPAAAQSSIPGSLDGPAVLVVTGSLWTQSANTLLTMNVQLDGTSIGTAKIWSNGVSTHRTFPALFLSVNLTYGQHVLTITP